MGSIDGTDVGLADGTDVGAPDGCQVGCSEGELEVKTRVGSTVGIETGSTVGSTEGAAIGSPVGRVQRGRLCGMRSCAQAHQRLPKRQISLQAKGAKRQGARRDDALIQQEAVCAHLTAGRGQLRKDKEGRRVGRARRQMIKGAREGTQCNKKLTPTPSRWRRCCASRCRRSAAAKDAPSAPERASHGPGRFTACAAGRAARGENVNPVLKKDQSGCGDQDSESKRQTICLCTIIIFVQTTCSHLNVSGEHFIR